MKSRSCFYCALATTLNIILNALTFKNFLWVEGRVRGGRFKNRARQFGYRPANFDKFLKLMHEHDAEDKFSNDFTRRLLI